MLYTISREKVQDYFSKTGAALEKIKVVAPVKTPLHDTAKDFFDMATRYYSDAKHFFEKEDFVNAFACLNYAHGWLDAGARLGLFDVGHDNKLFTVD